MSLLVCSAKSLLCTVLPLGKKWSKVGAIVVGVATERSAAEAVSEVTRNQV